MKVSRPAFTSAIAMAAKVAPNRPTLPMLNGALIAHGATPGTITVSATDLETRLHLEIPYEGDPLPGAACIDAKTLLKLLKTFDGPDLELGWNDPPSGEICPALIVDGIRIEGLANPAEFPQIVPPPEPVVVPGLYGAMEFCLPFSSTDESRYTLNSVYVNSSEKKTTVVASTDGHRLATAWLPKAEITALIASDALKTLFSAPFKKSLQPDMAGWTDKDISFPLKNGYLTSILLEGTFPDVQRVIPCPESTQIVIEADRAGLIATLTRAIAMSAADPRRSPVTLVGDGRDYVVIAGTGETELQGSGAVVPANGSSGEFAIGMNAHYLKGALEVLTGTTVALNIRDGMTPIWISEGKMPTPKAPATWQSGRRTIVIMPMRTSYTMRIEDQKKAQAPAAASPVEAEAVAEAS